ncbi:hypothetical protein B5X24_HaOG200908 [Helicoverpa armigera]|nr:hypothetical protein B5X24_HaOG200908 [Helicoverpa armigera]
MLTVHFLLTLSLASCRSDNIHIIEPQTKMPLIMCITHVIEKYFSEQKVLTYVDMDSDDNVLLKAIHSLKATAVVFRQPFIRSPFRHRGYLIAAKTSNIFADHFKKLRQEPTWNPAARFLIVIKILKEDELKKIFDVLLESHVFNSLLINATDEAQIYTYNPFDKYACGHYYSEVIYYGECSQTKTDLYPNKLVTGFKNCSFRASVPHRPPYSVDRAQLNNITQTDILGTEQLVLKLLGEKEQFQVNYTYDYDKFIYSTISPNMTVSGPMKTLTNNESDIIFGGIWLVASRSDAFTYLYGHLDFEDDLLIIVKRASLVAIWKTTFLEFQPTVWGLLVMTFLLYSVMMIRILGADDKFGVMMTLFKNLLANSVHIPNRSEVKRIFLTWIWFSFLINSIYQSSLFSLTSHPAKEHQVYKIREIFVYKMKPCINPSMLIYIETEMNVSTPIDNNCLDTPKNLYRVCQSDKIFTLAQKFVYQYYKKLYCDRFGQPRVYYFNAPYAQLMFGIFFYKGFPITDRMQTHLLRFKENGLVSKCLKDHYYSRKIKHHFHEKEFEARFILPWVMHLIGCVLATIVFIFELLSKRFKWFQR